MLDILINPFSAVSRSQQPPCRDATEAQGALKLSEIERGGNYISLELRKIHKRTVGFVTRLQHWKG